MVKKGFLKGYSNILNFILRLMDLSIILVCGVLSYYFSAAYETYNAIGIHDIPEHYINLFGHRRDESGDKSR